MVSGTATAEKASQTRLSPRDAASRTRLRAQGTLLDAYSGDGTAAVPEKKKYRSRKEQVKHLVLEGFDPETTEYIRKALIDCGLPLDGIDGVTLYTGVPLKSKDDEGREWHTAGWYDPATRFVTIAPTELVPRQRLIGTLIHEVAHSHSPFLAIENAPLAPLSDDTRETIAFVRSVTQQTLETRRFLDGYHAKLCQKYLARKITFSQLAEETWAILIELRYTDPNHLRQVDQAQKQALDRRGLGELAVSLLSSEDATKAEGIDKILMQQIGFRSMLGWRRKNPAVLDRFLNNFRSAHYTAEEKAPDVHEIVALPGIGAAG